MKRIRLSQPKIGVREKLAVLKVLNSGNLVQGEGVRKFELEFSKLLNGANCIAVNSGTSALHLSLLSLEIGPGDEVIVPSFSFAASANSISLTGAKPVFCDVDRRTFNILPSEVEKKITSKTRAIMAVHLYGLPADLEELQKIASAHNIFLIEDAAQAHLSSIDLKPVGTFGKIASFSFYPSKNMTSGEGGMIVTHDDSIARTCRMLRNQGMEVRYQNEIVGFNNRMTDLHAAIGIVQLQRLRAFTEKRIENAAFLSRLLKDLETPYTPERFVHVFHQYTVKLDESIRDEVRAYLSSKLIENGVYYPTPIHKLPSHFSKIELPNTNRLAKQVLSLPIHPGLNRSDLKRVASRLMEAIDDRTRNSIGI